MLKGEIRIQTIAQPPHETAIVWTHSLRLYLPFKEWRVPQAKTALTALKNFSYQLFVAASQDLAYSYIL